jgi:general secretion pathway protein H
MDKRIRGFTLIELLVALAIVGIVAALVSVSARPDERALLELEATRLASALALAAKEARLTGNTIVWRSDGAGYAFARYPEDRAEMLPNPVSDLKPRTLPAGIAIIAAHIAGARQHGDMYLAFAGRAPVELFTLELQSGSVRYAVASTAMGDVRASRLIESHSASR